jgi:hypothetical protein
MEAPLFSVMKATLHVDLGFTGCRKSHLAKISRQSTTVVVPITLYFVIPTGL